MVRIVKSKYMQTDSVEVIDSQKEENILNYKVWYCEMFHIEESCTIQ